MGKPQLVVEDAKKPAAGFVTNQPVWASPEDLQELNEEYKSIEKVRQRTNARATKVSLFLKDNYFRTDKTFTFLYWPLMKRQMSVRYFFPKKNLAVDQFLRVDKDVLTEIAFKNAAFKDTKIKYFPMMPNSRLLDLAEYI